jgi:hypothetical protein
MRRSNYYGIAYGVGVIEKRAGSVSSIVLGRVDRAVPEGADHTLRFTPVCEVSNRARVRELETVLRRTYGAARGGGLQALAPFDTAISAAIEHEARP